MRACQISWQHSALWGGFAHSAQSSRGLLTCCNLLRGILLLMPSVLPPCHTEAACWRLRKKVFVRQVPIPEREWDLALLPLERCNSLWEMPAVY